jgi:hypothetical protein
MQKFLEGKNWPAVPPFGMGVVDVDDVAAAHALAAFTPSASGRCAVWRSLLLKGLHRSGLVADS